MVARGFNTTVTLHSTDTRLATAGYLTLTATLGTLGNMLVIVSIVRMKKLGQLYYVLIANLNIVALITSVCLIPSHIVNIINSGLIHSNTELCKVLGYLNFTLTLEVLLNTSAIAVERCMVVHQTTQNFKRHRSNRMKNITVIVILWAVPAIVSITGFPFIGYHPFMLDCFFVVSNDSFWYILFALSSPAAISMLVIFVSYFLTLKKVRDSHRKVAALCLSNQNDKHVNTDCVIPSSKKTVDNSIKGITKHSEANTSFNIQHHDSHAKSHNEVTPSDLPSTSKTKFDDNHLQGNTKPPQPNANICILQHTAAIVNKHAEAASTEMSPTVASFVNNYGHYTAKHFESDTCLYMVEHDVDDLVQSETAPSEKIPSTGKQGTSEHLEVDTLLYTDTGGYISNDVTPSEKHVSTRKQATSEHSKETILHTDDGGYIPNNVIPNEKLPSTEKQATFEHSEEDTILHTNAGGYIYDEIPSKILETVPVICLKQPAEEELETDSNQSNLSPSVFVGHPPEELNSPNESEMNQTLSSPDYNNLSKLSTEEKHSCNLTDIKEYRTAHESIMKRELNLELSKKSLFRSTMLIGKKNVTEKVMSLRNKDKQSSIHKQHLTINNPGSVPSISSLIAETNMEEGEQNTGDNNRMVRKVVVGMMYNKQMRRELSITIHLFPVFVIFCCMYLPICMIQAIHVYHPVSPNVWLTFSTLELSFSTLSWVLYGVLNKEFRRAYKNILCCR